MATAVKLDDKFTQQQGRIFALLYLQDGSLSLEEIAAELEQSKSNVSLNIRTSPNVCIVCLTSDTPCNHSSIGNGTP